MSKNIAFSISKPNFIIYNTPLYNTTYIKTSIFLPFHLNNVSLLFFNNFLFLLSLVSLSSISPQWVPLNKKIIYSLQLINSAVSNMRLHCSSIAKIISFKTFDGASFWVKNAKKKKRFLTFKRFDKNALCGWIQKIGSLQSRRFILKARGSMQKVLLLVLMKLPLLHASYSSNKYKYSIYSFFFFLIFTFFVIYNLFILRNFFF